MFEKKEEETRLWPGDEGYLGGIFDSTVYIGGKAKNVRTEKDPDGAVRSVIVTDKIFGIF